MSVEVFKQGLELFADQWQAPGTIDFYASGDLDDYISFSVTSNRPLITGVGNYLVLGKDGTAGSATSADDVLVGGKLEVDGMAYLDGGTTFAGAIAGGDQAFTGVGDMTFTAGSILKSGSTNGDTLLLAANDTTFITLTTGATDVCTIANATMSGTWLASGTVTLPAFTLGGTLTLGGQQIVGPMTLYEAGFADILVKSDRNADGEAVGGVKFYGKNDNATPAETLYARVDGVIVDSADGAEKGRIDFLITTGAGGLGAVLKLSNDGTKTTFESLTGDYFRFGDGAATSHNLNHEDDVMVAGELEVDGAAFLDGGMSTGGFYNTGAETDVTIATGVIAVTKSYHSVIVQGGGGGGADALASATGGSEGGILILKANTTGANDTVTVTDGTGANTFILAGGADFVMDHIDDRIMLIHNGTEWVEISRSTNS